MKNMDSWTRSCANCSHPFDTNLIVREITIDLTLQKSRSITSQKSSSRTAKPQWKSSKVIKILRSIYRLRSSQKSKIDAKTFKCESPKEGEDDDDRDEVAVCSKCAEILTSLFLFYDEFNQRRSPTSYLAHKINDERPPPPTTTRATAAPKNVIPADGPWVRICRLRSDLLKTPTQSSPAVTTVKNDADEDQGDTRSSSWEKEGNKLEQESETSDSVEEEPSEPTGECEDDPESTNFDHSDDDYQPNESDSDSDAAAPASTPNDDHFEPQSKLENTNSSSPANAQPVRRPRANKSEKIYTRHKWQRSEVAVPCPLCSVNMDDVVHHLFSSHTTDDSSTCPICSKLCYRRAQLKRHLRSHIPSNARIYPCPTCGKIFGTGSSLSQHVKTHSDVRPHLCAECGVRCSTAAKLRNHLLIHSDLKTYQCSLCPRTFKQTQGLWSHEKRAHPQQNVSEGGSSHLCPICGKVVMSAWSLKTHIRTHDTEDRPHKCPVELCERAFGQKHHLRDHLRTHTKERPYKCSFQGCQQSFTQSSSLKRHLLAHTGEKPYKCKVEGCGAAFGESGTLAGHLRVHTRETPYSCPRCLKEFCSRQARNKHLAKRLPNCVALSSDAVQNVEAQLIDQDLSSSESEYQDDV